MGILKKLSMLTNRLHEFSNGERMEDDTLMLSDTPAGNDTILNDDNPDGAPVMSVNAAQEQVEMASRQFSKHLIPGQVAPTASPNVRRLEQQPMAQYDSYQQMPPVRRMAPSQMMQQVPQAPPPVQPQPMQYQQQPMMPAQPYYPPPQYYPPQQIPYQAPQQGMSDGFGAPFSEIYVTSNNEYECWIDLPGMDKDSLTVRVFHNALEVSGTRRLRSESNPSGKRGKRSLKIIAVNSSVPRYLLDKFKYTFPFIKPVDEDNISAEYVDGQLHVVISVLSSEKGVKVAVKI